MEGTHQAHVEAVLGDAAAAHANLIPKLPPELRESLPVDAQGLTEAIDYLAGVAGLSVAERRAILRPHATNPAVLHARVFGAEPLTRETVISSFVEGARVRADALTALADTVGGPALGTEIRSLLVANPLPAGAARADAVEALQDAYAAQERAAVIIAATLDGTDAQRISSG
jgi:hypothetical protein